MDLDYLLFLQNLRESAPAFITAFFTFMSEFIISPLSFMIPAVIFWCINKRAGNYIVFCITGSNIIGDTLKNIVCAYRPWIRDMRIESTLKTTATGYSFPSGHTSTAVAFYGGIGVTLRKLKKWILPVLLIPAAITGFARNWVGAHTPQDVVAGFILSAVLMYAFFKLFEYLDKNPGKDIIVVAVGLVTCILALVYISVKSYPMDYNADGTLLVDPSVMMIDAFKSAGRFIGFLLGFIFERRLVNFNEKGTMQRRIIRAVIGVVTALLIYLFTKSPLVAAFGEKAGGLLHYVITLFYATGLYPLFIKLVQKKLSK